jgi:hypothetical protein
MNKARHCDTKTAKAEFVRSLYSHKVSGYNNFVKKMLDKYGKLVDNYEY